MLLRRKIRRSHVVILLIVALSSPLAIFAQADTLTWETLDGQVQQLEQEGISGALLLARGGEIVYERGFGLANRERQIAVTPETIFAIGSTPIDFTKAGILLLADRGKLAMNDPITKFFDEVPADKQAITVHHLMTGRSGLQNFHDRPTDENKDHSWIDRDEAIRRIFAQELLFAPGKGREHSHSAFGVLAAIIEIVSGQTYPEFTREELFAPLGVDDIGFFGEELPVERVAVGYGYDQSSDPNSPPHWGPTSWLVMGSGGQVSTLRDIFEWNHGLRGGKLLSKKLHRQYFGRGGNVYSNGDMFGFEFIFNDDPEGMAFLISNSIDSREKRERFDEFGQALMRLVRGRRDAPPPKEFKFSLGIAMQVSSEGVIVDGVVPDGAADRGGVQANDVILRIGGVDVGENPLGPLEKYLENGSAIPLTVERGGEQIELTVTPLPKGD